MKKLLLALASTPLLFPLTACRSTDRSSTATTTNAAVTATSTATPTAPPAKTTAAEPTPRAAAPTSKECIVLDATDPNADGKAITLEGIVVVDSTFAQPSAGVTKPYILKLTQKRCVTNGGDTKIVDEVHLADPQGYAHLKSWVGKSVKVHGAPFHAHTAWHARDIVLMTSVVSPR